MPQPPALVQGRGAKTTTKIAFARNYYTPDNRPPTPDDGGLDQLEQRMGKTRRPVVPGDGGSLYLAWA